MVTLNETIEIIFRLLETENVNDFVRKQIEIAIIECKVSEYTILFAKLQNLLVAYKDKPEGTSFIYVALKELLEGFK
jgi:hypothetical protein